MDVSHHDWSRKGGSCARPPPGRGSQLLKASHTQTPHLKSCARPPRPGEDRNRPPPAAQYPELLSYSAGELIRRERGELLAEIRRRRAALARHRGVAR